MLQYNNNNNNTKRTTTIINRTTNQLQRLHRPIITAFIVGDNNYSTFCSLLKVMVMMILSCCYQRQYRWCYCPSIGSRCTAFVPITIATKKAAGAVIPLLLFNTFKQYTSISTAIRYKRNTLLSLSIISSLSTTNSLGWTFHSSKYISNKNAYYSAESKSISVSSLSKSSKHVNRGGSYETDDIQDKTKQKSNDNNDSMKPKRIRRITFITDVEGDKEYMKRYATISKVICFRPINDTDLKTIQKQNNDNTNNTGYQIKFPYTECLDFRTTCTNELEHDNNVNNNNHKNIQYENIFVFGGDIWDQGGNDLYVIRQLLYFKYRYPSTVFLLIGNRDGNKMRIVQELGTTSTSTSIEEQKEQNNDNTNQQQQQQQQENIIVHDNNNIVDVVPYHKGAYWLRGSGYIGDPLNGPLPYNQTSVKRLQWMLQYTMGSPRAFLYRKQELIEEQILQQQFEQEPRLITDYDVVTSYRNSCHPITGEMGYYLSCGQLILQFGSLLFVHGGLPISPKIIQSVQENTNNNSNNQNQQQQSHNMKDTTSSINDNFWNDLSFATPWIDRTTGSNSAGQLSFDEWIVQLNKFASDCVTNWKDEYSLSITTTKTKTNTNTPLQSNQQQQEQLHQRRRHDMWSWTGGYHQQQQEPQQQQQQEHSSDDSTDTTTSTTLSSSLSYVPKFTQLIQYGMGSLPNRIPNPTVVYNGCWKHYLPKDPPTTVVDTNNNNNKDSTNKMDHNNDNDYHDDDDLLVQDIVQSFMKNTGIRLICCGHQPQGDMPNAIRVPVPVTGTQRNDDGSDNDNVNVGWIVSADTSYSGDTVWFNRNEDDSNSNNINNKMLTTDSNNTPQTNTKPSNTEHAIEIQQQQQQQEQEKVLNRYNIGRGTMRSGRGPVAVSEVYIEQCVDTCTVHELYFHGVLCDGTMYKTTNFFQLDNNTNTNNNKQPPNSYTADYDNNNIINSSTTVSDTDISTEELVVGTIAKGNLVPDRSISPHNGYWWNRATFDYLYKPIQSLSSSDNDVANNTSSVQTLFHNIINEWNTINNSTSDKHTTTATTTTTDNNNNTPFEPLHNFDSNNNNNNKKQKLQTLTMIVARKGFQVWNHIIRSCN